MDQKKDNNSVDNEQGKSQNKDDSFLELKDFEKKKEIKYLINIKTS